MHNNIFIAKVLAIQLVQINMGLHRAVTSSSVYSEVLKNGYVEG